MEVLSDLIKDSVSAFDQGSGGGSGDSIYIQPTEPSWGVGEKGLWIDTTGGNLNFWIRTP